LTIFELRGEWRRLHRVPPPMRLSRDLLVRGITYKLQERAYGGLEYGGIKYDRMQFLTVKDILEDKREFHAPTKMVSRISTAQGSLAL
jgi:hypothetical protein